MEPYRNARKFLLLRQYLTLYYSGNTSNGNPLFYTFGGGHYLQKGNTAALFRPGSDLSAGIEFKINKMFSAWMDVNNILNDKYQRWHGYEVYGLNFLGGVKVSF